MKKRLKFTLHQSNQVTQAWLQFLKISFRLWLVTKYQDRFQREILCDVRAHFWVSGHRGRALPACTVLPEISSDPAGFLKINDRGNRLSSEHLPFTLNLSDPVVILYAVNLWAAVCSKALLALALTSNSMNVWTSEPYIFFNGKQTLHFGPAASTPQLLYKSFHGHISVETKIYKKMYRIEIQKQRHITCVHVCMTYKFTFITF